MYTDVQIVNLALGKVTSSRIQRLDPPTSALEVYMYNGYTPWKRTELTKRRWVFALEDQYDLPLAGSLEGDGIGGRTYKFLLPPECLRPVRQSRSEWVQRGRYLYSANRELKIQFVRNAPEADFDPLFVDVLASWIAYQSVEYVTQSNTKKANAKSMYAEAVSEAARMNAFIIGPEDIADDDTDFTFVTDRYR